VLVKTHVQCLPVSLALLAAQFTPSLLWCALFLPLPPATCQAVDTIHLERIVHSDLKPANFLVVEGQLKLIDFGIAKAIQSGE